MSEAILKMVLGPLSIRKAANVQDKNELIESGTWNYIHETLSMLSLSVVQIQVSMSEGDYSVNTLTDTFVRLVIDIRNILNEFKDELSKMQDPNLTDKVQEITDDICTRVNDGIVAFQFYDRLTQRLSHISDGLESVGLIIGDEEKRHDPKQWINLQSDLRSRYTMEAEREMFDAIMSGRSIQDALKLYTKPPETNQQQGDVELF